MKINEKESALTTAQNDPSAPARHENPEQTDQTAPTGGGSGAAPCSASSGASDKQDSIDRVIAFSNTRVPKHPEIIRAQYERDKHKKLGRKKSPSSRS